MKISNRSHARQVRIFSQNFAVASFPLSNVIPAQAGTQALRPFSLGTRLRGYDGLSR